MDITDKPDPAFGQRKGFIIAGPTASGKSSLALALAEAFAGTIINADAMQCYQDLRVITARPSIIDESRVAHRLYGVRASVEPANAAWWRSAAQAEMEQASLPLLCGGTGMYFSALIKGIADIPDPGEAARAQARALLGQIGPVALHARLDEATASRLKPQDSQRIARAYEVLRGTGQGLAYWQARATSGLQGWHLKMLLLDPPRAELRAALTTRFDAMLKAGAIDEVKALLAQDLPSDLPLLRAYGVPELAAYLRDEITLEEAKERTILASFQYTKRQMTWFRHQELVCKTDIKIIHSRIDGNTQFLESIIDEYRNFIKQSG